MKGQNNLAAARFRAESHTRIRAFFAARGVLEVETPLLSRGASHDFHLDLFTVPVPGEAARFLQTSPEPHMKRLLARGYPDLFQICKAFRLGERGSRHNPEFSLLEWYRRDFSLPEMMEETLAVCRLVAGTRPSAFRTYGEAFSRATGLDPFSASREQLLSHPAVARRGLGPSDFPEAPDVLNFLMSEVVEPGFDPGTLTVVHGFPATLVSQALPDPEHPESSLRFEIFGGGMELANGYRELRDPREYRRRFEEENWKRRAAGKTVPPLDERLLSDLEAGLPSCSGVALGLDRLIQFGIGAVGMNEVLEFDWGKS